MLCGRRRRRAGLARDFAVGFVGLITSGWRVASRLMRRRRQRRGERGGAETNPATRVLARRPHVCRSLPPRQRRLRDGRGLYRAPPKVHPHYPCLPAAFMGREHEQCVLGPTALEPLFVSCASHSAVAVRGKNKCKPTRWLSGAISMHPPLSCRGWHLIFAHAYAETPRVIWHLSPRHLPPPPITIIYSLVNFIRVGTAGRCLRWWFSGDRCPGWGSCPARVTFTVFFIVFVYFRLLNFSFFY